MVQKGPSLEELVREYFSKQGFYALRGVKLLFESEEVTDIDVWLYGRQSAGVRTRVVVDVKNKRSPKAFERILWTRGLQLALGCDRAIVATTDGSAKVTRFAQQQKVALLSTKFLAKLEKRLSGTESGRISTEDLEKSVREYPNQKQDGDWIRHIASAKSAVVSLAGFPGFNLAVASFKFFAERAETRPQHREQALRCAFFAASLACIALDAAISQVVYEEASDRHAVIEKGVTYGDSGDGKVTSSIEFVLDVISNGMPNGRVVASQVEGALDKLFEGVRADIIAEHFSKEHNASALFMVAKELDERAHSAQGGKIQDLSIDAKSVLGVFADFVGAKRAALFNGATLARDAGYAASESKVVAPDAKDSVAEPEKSPPVVQEKLI
jgi:hypothetical protein